MTFSAAAGRACEPNDPLLRLGWAATALRQHRGDGHLAAPLTAVINPCEALVLAAAAAPRASAWALEAPRSTAVDQPHDQRSARHRQQQSAGPTKQQSTHEPAQQRATDPDHQRHTDAHRVGAGDDESPQGADDQSRQQQSKNPKQHDDSLPQLRSLLASPRHHRQSAGLGRGGRQNALRRHDAC
jgi:hypothetical protein